MEQLKALGSLVVSQKKEWGEILTNFETKNKYSVCDTAGTALFYAAEIGGSFIIRGFLKAWRPFTINIVNQYNDICITLKRPFRLFFSRLELFDSAGMKIGTVQQKFSLLQRVYVIHNAVGEELLSLVGPLLHPWTFNIVQGDAEIGRITKKWTGLGKEMFTDADNFSITFPESLDLQTKSILLGAVFLIDFVYFENRK